MNNIQKILAGVGEATLLPNLAQETRFQIGIINDNFSCGMPQRLRQILGAQEPLELFGCQ